MYRITSILRYGWSRNLMSDCTCIYKSVRNHLLCIFMLLDAEHCYLLMEMLITMLLKYASVKCGVINVVSFMWENIMVDT